MKKINARKRGFFKRMLSHAALRKLAKALVRASEKSESAGDEILYGRESLLNDIREVMGGERVSVVNYITVDGAKDPTMWASEFSRSLKQYMRMA